MRVLDVKARVFMFYRIGELLWNGRHYQIK